MEPARIVSKISKTAREYNTIVARMSISVSSYIAPSSSAAGVVSFLEEEDQLLRTRALEKLYRVIDVHWAEVRI
jgi:hypothetical protein